MYLGDQGVGVILDKPVVGGGSLSEANTECPASAASYNQYENYIAI